MAIVAEQKAMMLRASRAPEGLARARGRIQGGRWLRGRHTQERGHRRDTRKMPLVCILRFQCSYWSHRLPSFSVHKQVRCFAVVGTKSSDLRTSPLMHAILLTHLIWINRQKQTLRPCSAKKPQVCASRAYA
eukprot:6185054-Pleurochrysis_carterae.AAC.1